MTKEQLASAINGRQYGEEMTGDEERQAQSNRLVVFFGASDDCLEVRGAITEEAYGDTILITKDGEYLGELEDDDKEILRRHGAHPNYSWVFTTSAPHAAFDVMEDESKFCRGLVIDLKELQ